MAADVRDVSVLRVVGTLVRWWKVLVSVPVAGGVLMLAAVYLTRDYRGEARFLPQSAAGAAMGLAGIAAQFGFQLASPSGESPDFYAQLVRSRDVLTALAGRQFNVASIRGEGHVRSGTLAQLLDRGDSVSAHDVLDKTLRRLERRVSARADLRSGIVTVQVVMPWPGLAEQVTTALLDLVNEFNLERRQSQASSERRFVEERLQEAATALEGAENELKVFLGRNRRYEESPDLQFEASRLQRRVDLHQQVHGALAQALEQARIEEVRNTPVLTVVDSPIGSARPATRLRTAGVVGFALGAIIALAAVMWREFLKAESDRNPADVAYFRDALRTAAHRAPR